VTRRELLLLLGVAVTASRALRAQQKPLPVIGFLSGTSAGPTAPLLAAFLQGLTETGYVEGENVAIEYRWAEDQYDRLPALAADLVARKVDVIAAVGGTPPALAAKNATATIPIVFGAGDPVGLGLVAGLDRPGGNLTGVSSLELGLLVNPTNAIAERVMQRAQEAARAKGLRLVVLKAVSENDIDAAFATLIQLQAGALVLPSDPFFNSRRDQLVALASRHAVPVIYDWREYAVAGGLISYGPSRTDTWRQCGSYVGKILKGAKPADLPVEQATRFELVVNLKTAKALGITVPPSILARVDEVIE